MSADIGGLQFRLESVVAAVETLLRAQQGDDDFLTDAAWKRIAQACDAYAMDRHPQLRGKIGGIRKLVHCRACGVLKQHASHGLCDACRGRKLRGTLKLEAA